MSPARRWPVVVAVVALVAGLAAVAYFTPLMSVRAVSVHGLESGSTLTADQVVAAAQVPKGRPLLQVNTAQAAHRVAAIAAVETARVRRQYPSAIEVIVVERRPVVRVETDRAVHGDRIVDLHPALGLAGLGGCGGGPIAGRSEFPAEERGHRGVG